MENWYAVQTQPRAERKAVFNLSRQGYRVYMPEHLKKRRHARQTDWVKAPFFPRYLFVRLDPSVTPWRPINSTIGVTSLVTLSDNRPTPVPDSIIETLRAREDESGLLSFDPTKRLKKGDVIRLKDGPFAEMDAVFEVDNEGDRITVLLELLGRPVRAKVARDSVERPA